MTGQRVRATGVGLLTRNDPEHDAPALGAAQLLRAASDRGSIDQPVAPSAHAEPGSKFRRKHSYYGGHARAAPLICIFITSGCAYRRCIERRKQVQEPAAGPCVAAYLHQRILGRDAHLTRPPLGTTLL